MPTRNARARWEGTIKEGKGTFGLPSVGFEGPFTYASRFEQGDGTNPEELIGAALAGCFSMFLSSLLTKAGYGPSRIDTSAEVTLDEGAIRTIDLHSEAEVPGVEHGEFQRMVQEAKQNCPVSKALAAPAITVEATLA